MMVNLLVVCLVASCLPASAKATTGIELLISQKIVQLCHNNIASDPVMLVEFFFLLLNWSIDIIYYLAMIGQFLGG